MNSQIKILLADESAVFLEQLRHVLERDPAFVIAGSANDAQRAVELLHRTQPDILILGLLLPERDGVSVLTAANALRRPPMTLALTGALTEQDAQKLGVEGTPYFLVNNMVVRGALPLDLFKGAVDMALKQNGK